MLGAYLVGVGGVVLLGALWVAVQRAWARRFPEAFADPDPLAERRDCRSCGCTEICERRRSRRPAPLEEDVR